MGSLFDGLNRYHNRSRARRRRPIFERMEERQLLSAISWTGLAGDSNWDTRGKLEQRMPFRERATM